MFLSAKISSFRLVYRSCNYYNILLTGLRDRPILSVIITCDQTNWIRALRNDNRPNWTPLSPITITYQPRVSRDTILLICHTGSLSEGKINIKELFVKISGY